MSDAIKPHFGEYVMLVILTKPVIRKSDLAVGHLCQTDTIIKTYTKNKMDLC